MKYLVISIVIIVFLVVIFFVTYFLNKRTPIPEECKDLRIGAEGCGSCNNLDCSIRKKVDFKKIEEDLKEDE